MQKNNQWLSDLLKPYHLSDSGAGCSYEKGGRWPKPCDCGLSQAEAAILSKLESIEQEAYKKGWQERGDYELRKYENDKG